MLLRRLIIMFLLGCGRLCCAQNYTCQADVYMPDAYAKKPAVASPDRSKDVRLWTTAKGTDPGPDDGKFYASIYAGTRLLKTIQLKDLSAATFVKWSPDSEAVYIMWSDGGAVGGYHVRAFRISGIALIESSAPKVAAADFRKRHYCKTRGNNLYAIRWENGSKQLLFRPEVYPASDCGKDMGFTSGYLVDVETGEINARYSSDQIERIAHRCPSVVFPSALATQESVKEYLQKHGEAMDK